jgi:hypothetical protein
MSRRWAPPKPTSPQQQLLLPQRGHFTPPVKLATDTSAAAGESLGIHRAGDLASALMPLLRRQVSKTRLAGVMLAVEIRGKVFQYLAEHSAGATADEIAAALNYSILTIRPRVSELNKQGRIVDSGLRRPNASGRNAIVWRIV